MLPFVSVIVPCRNEEKYIARCLDSLLANDYPKDRLEILILDGMSEDKTRSIVEDFAKRYPFIGLVENRKRSIPAAMNTGIRAARGDVIVKMDAHSLYDRRHISGCVHYMREYGTENVGGIWNMQPGAETLVARAIVYALGSRFGSGNAAVKTGADKPTLADSVAFGCFRKEFIENLGGYDERLFGSSDMDLNRRIRAAGGRILLVPEIVVQYLADATLRAFWRHNFADGVWIAYSLKFGSRAWSWRHWVPFAFVSSLLALLALSLVWHRLFWLFLAVAGAYAAVNLATSAQIAARQRSGKLMLLLPAVFIVRHFVHGMGTLYGLLLVALPGAHWKGRRGAKG